MGKKKRQKLNLQVFNSQLDQVWYDGSQQGDILCTYSLKVLESPSQAFYSLLGPPTDESN